MLDRLSPALTVYVVPVPASGRRGRAPGSPDVLGAGENVPPGLPDRRRRPGCRCGCRAGGQREQQRRRLASLGVRIGLVGVVADVRGLHRWHGAVVQQAASRSRRWSSACRRLAASGISSRCCFRELDLEQAADGVAGGHRIVRQVDRLEHAVERCGHVVGLLRFSAAHRRRTHHETFHGREVGVERMLHSRHLRGGVVADRIGELGRLDSRYGVPSTGVT